MKLLLVSDEESKYIWDYYDETKFKDIDLIISCGDLKSEYLSFLVTVINKPVLYVHGNHDDKYAVKEPEGCDCIDGKLVKFKGLNILGLGGSQKYREGLHQYDDKAMNKRLNKLKPKIWLNGGVDILVTHAPAYKLGDGEDLCHRGFQCFNTVLDKYKPKYFFHGHQHLNYNKGERIRKYNDTTIVNAYEYYIIEI